MMKADVIVVGGGISGLSTAYWLLVKGVKRVIVLEKSYLGSGSTFRCATGIRASFTSEEHIIAMRESIKLWKDLSEQLDFPYMRGGYVWLFTQEDQIKIYEEYSRLHNSLGVPTRIVDSREVQRLVPVIDIRHILGGLYDPLAGKANPFKVMYAFNETIRKLGGEILTGVNVTKILTKGERIVGVQTTKGTIESDNVVVAAGYGSRKLLEQLGVSMPLKNIPHHAVITEPFKPAFNPLVVDVSTGAYIVQTFDGGFIMGAEIEDIEDGPLTPRIEFMKTVAKIWLKFFPWLKSINFLRYWVGYYVVSPDHHPIIGPINRYKGLYVAAGFSGHGFMIGPITGKILAEWILEDGPKIPQLRRLSYQRIEEGRLIKEKAIIG